MQPATSLLALNFALAGAREGFGPFLGVYLQQQGFAPASTGLAMGLAGVAIPALVAEIMEGTGHAGAGLGGVMTAYGAGAALSPTLAGLVAQGLGFAAAFVALSGVAGLGLLLWSLGRRWAGGPTTDARHGVPDAGLS